jgi:hypothetical protein
MGERRWIPSTPLPATAPGHNVLPALNSTDQRLDELIQSNRGILEELRKLTQLLRAPAPRPSQGDDGLTDFREKKKR